MDRKTRVRKFVLPAILLILATGSFSRIQNSDGVRAIHVFSLIVIGMLLGILLQNLIGLLRDRK
ncbi:MAG: hypothetical protein IPP83_06890 [Flavobacteriales bacterium]|nr:hypothetical protein [Flavobacteriales bacterium]